MRDLDYIFYDLYVDGELDDGDEDTPETTYCEVCGEEYWKCDHE